MPIFKLLMPKGPWLTALVLAAIGLVLAAGGALLIKLGGSWYYALTGLGLVASAILLWRGSTWGLRLYWLILGATLIWAVAESGLHLWSLAPRVLGPLFIGLWLCTHFLRRTLDLPKRTTPTEPVLTAEHVSLAALTILAIASIGALLQSGAPRAQLHAGIASDWPMAERTLSGTRYAAPTQITPRNVGALREAWTFHTGEFGPTFEAQPTLVGDLLVFCTPRNVVYALDPDTGQERWRFDPHADTGLHMLLACRGIAQEREASAGPCAQRVFVATVDARLIALDATNGQRCAGFGVNGEVSLMQGIGDYPRGFYYSTSPPLAVDGVLVVGAFVLDNQTVVAPSGVIRAFDAHTGTLRWAWDMGVPDRHGAPPAGETYTRGTPNAWAPFSADPALGLVYVPMGNPAPDFWGGKRRPFDERYGSAIVALDVRTGVPRWSFQTTHHDLWDYDVPAQPVLVDIPTASSTRPALVQGTKRGDIFVLDRRTGEPIFPVAEQTAPQDAAPGDRTASTQPHSSLTLAPPPLRESDAWGLTPIDQMLCRIQFRRLRYEGMFTPPGLTPSLKFPGGLGVMDWGGLTIDEDRAILVANTSAVPYIDQLVPRAVAPADMQHISDARLYDWGPQEETPFVIHTHAWMSRFNVPCTAPPWGRITGIDLHSGRTLWSQPLGSAENSGPFNWRSHLPLPMGVPNIGGAITTRSGLTFVAASVDQYFRAFDTRTGELLWQGQLPASGHAIPLTYVSPRTGRQFVVIAAGGHASMGPHLGDALVAFALPANVLGNAVTQTMRHTP